MKKVYIPKGETVSHAELHTEVLVVNGTLKVAGKLTAKSIQGSGVVEAQEIVGDSIQAHTVIAQIVTATQIAVRKLLVRDCRAGEILVTDFLEALKVQANRLSMTLSAVELCEADEIITLPQKKRGMLGMLVASRWRCLLLPNNTAAKTAKPKTEQPEQVVQPEVSAETAAEPAISEDFLDALIDRLEERGFVYDAPCAPVESLPFSKVDVA